MEQYEMVRVLGEGSFGSAVLAKHRATQQLLVLKRIPLHKLPGKAVADAKKEVQVLSSLHHPHVTEFVRSFECGGELIIGMEYCAGGDLKAVLGQRAGVLLPQDRILDWFVQLCLAVKYIHDLHILHRDIKAQNIFLTEDGRVKLGDFGISKVLESSKELASTCIGTPYYLSPEMCQNKPYNSKSDVWALGCVLYEMAALRHPFEATCMKSLVMKILRGSVRPVPAKFTWDFKALVRQILQSNPQARPSVTTILAKNILLDRVPKYIAGIDGNLDLIIALKERKDAAKQKGKKLSACGPEITAPAAKYGQSVVSKTSVRRISPHRKKLAGKRPSPNYLKKSSPKYASKSSLASSNKYSHGLPKTPSLLPDQSLNKSQRRQKSKSVDNILEDRKVSVSKSKLVGKKSPGTEAVRISYDNDCNNSEQSVDETKVLTPDVESILRDISNGKYCIKKRSPNQMRVNETKTVKTSGHLSNHRFRRKRDSVYSIVRGKSVDSLLDDEDFNWDSPPDAAASDTFFDVDSNKDKENIKSDETLDKNVENSGVVDKENCSKFVPGSTVSDSHSQANSDLNETRIEKVKCCNRTRLFSRDLSPVRAVKSSMTSSPCFLQRSPSTVPEKPNSEIQCDQQSNKELHSSDRHLELITDSLESISRKIIPILRAEEEEAESVCSSTPIRSTRPNWCPWNPAVLAQAPLETTCSQMDATSGADKVTLHVKSDQARSLLKGANQGDILEAAARPVLSRAVDVEFDLVRLAIDNEAGSKGDRSITVPVSNLTETYLKSPASVNCQKILHSTERRQWTRPQSSDIVEWLNSAKIVEATLDSFQTSALLTSLLLEGESPLRRTAWPQRSGLGDNTTCCDSNRPRGTNSCYKSLLAVADEAPTSEDSSKGSGGKSTGNCGNAVLNEFPMPRDVFIKDDEGNFEKVSEGTFLISPSKQGEGLLSTTYTKVEDKCFDSDVHYKVNKSIPVTNVGNDVFNKPDDPDKCFKKPTNRLLQFLLRRGSQTTEKMVSPLKGGVSSKSPTAADEGTANIASIHSDVCFSSTSSELNSIKLEYQDQESTAESKRGLAYVLRKMSRVKNNGPKALVSKPFSCGYRKQMLLEKHSSETNSTSEHDVHRNILVSNSKHRTTSADESGSINDLNSTQSYNFKCNATEKHALVSEKNIKMPEVLQLHASDTDRIQADASLKCSIASTINILSTNESGYNTRTTVSGSTNRQGDHGNCGVHTGCNSFDEESGTGGMSSSAWDKCLSTVAHSLQERSKSDRDIPRRADSCAVTALPDSLTKVRDASSKRCVKVEAIMPTDGSVASDSTVPSSSDDRRPQYEATPAMDASNLSPSNRDVQIRRLAEIFVGSIIRKSRERFAVENAVSRSDNHREDEETNDVLEDRPTSCKFGEKSSTSVNSSASVEDVILNEMLEFVDPDIVNHISQVNIPNDYFTKSDFPDKPVASKYISGTMSFCLNEGSHVPETFSQENKLAETHTTSIKTNGADFNRLDATSEQKMIDHFYSCLYSTLGSNCASKRSHSGASIGTRPSDPIIEQPTNPHTSIILCEPSSGGSFVWQAAASSASDDVLFERSSSVNGLNAVTKETLTANNRTNAGLHPTIECIAVGDVTSDALINDDVPSSNHTTPSTGFNLELLEPQGTLSEGNSMSFVDDYPYELSHKQNYVQCYTPHLAGSNRVCLFKPLAFDAVSEYATKCSEDGCSMPDAPTTSPERLYLAPPPQSSSYVCFSNLTSRPSNDRLRVAEVSAEDGDSFYSAVGDDIDAAAVGASSVHRAATYAAEGGTRRWDKRGLNIDSATSGDVTVKVYRDDDSTCDPFSDAANDSSPNVIMKAGGILHAAEATGTIIPSSTCVDEDSLHYNTICNDSSTVCFDGTVCEVDFVATGSADRIIGISLESDSNWGLATKNHVDDNVIMPLLEVLIRSSDDASCRGDAKKDDATSHECDVTDRGARVMSYVDTCICDDSKQTDRDYIGSDVNFQESKTFEKSMFNENPCAGTLDTRSVTHLIHESSCVSCNNNRLHVTEDQHSHFTIENGLSSFRSFNKSELTLEKSSDSEITANYLDSDAITLTFPSEVSEDFCIDASSTSKLRKLIIDVSHETQCTPADNSILQTADFPSSKSFVMNRTASKPSIEHFNGTNFPNFLGMQHHPITNSRCVPQSPVPSELIELVTQNDGHLVKAPKNIDYALTTSRHVVDHSACYMELPNHDCGRTSSSNTSVNPSASDLVYSESLSQSPTPCVGSLASGPATAPARHAWEQLTSRCKHLTLEPLSEGYDEDVFGWIEEQCARLEDCLGLEFFKECHTVATQAVEDGASVNALVELLFRTLTMDGSPPHKSADVHNQTICSLHESSVASVMSSGAFKCCCLKKKFEAVGSLARSRDERPLLDRDPLTNQRSSLEQQGTENEVCLPSTVGDGTRSSCAGWSESAAVCLHNSGTPLHFFASCSQTNQNISDLVGDKKELVKEPISSNNEGLYFRSPLTSRLERSSGNNEQEAQKYYSLPDDLYFKKANRLISKKSYSTHQPKNLELSGHSPAAEFSGGPSFKNAVTNGQNKNNISTHFPVGDQTNVSVETNLITPSSCAFQSLNETHVLRNTKQRVTSQTLNCPNSTSSEMVASVSVVDSDPRQCKLWLQDLSVSLFHLVRAEAAYWA